MRRHWRFRIFGKVSKVLEVPWVPDPLDGFRAELLEVMVSGVRKVYWKVPGFGGEGLGV